MNASRAGLIEQIVMAFRANYPQFPVAINESADDRCILCVRVFSVPPNEVKQIKAFVRQLQRDFVSDGEYLLLPMVKNVETTRQYYPEYLRTDTIETLIQMVEAKLSKAPTVWKLAWPSNGSSFNVTMRPFEFELAQRRLSGDCLTPLQGIQTGVANNEELSLAA